MPRHLGFHVSAWLTPEQDAKLSELCDSSGLSKSEVLRRLIMNRELPNRSYINTLRQISKLGGLMKHRASGDHELFELGREVLAIAHKLLAEASDAQDHGEEDQNGQA